MKTIVVWMLIAQAPALPAGMPPATDWRNGGAAAGYTMDAAGRATDPAGATITLRAPAQPTGFGNTSATIPADAVRLKRITLSGELQADGVSVGASLWLRIDKGTTMLMLDNGAGDALKGTVDWTRRAISVPVPPDATTVVFGLLLRGGGSVTVRRLRLEAGEALTPDAPLVPAAKAVLDEALKVARTRSLNRNKVDWPIVEPNVRAMAGGAQKSADVYPAIKYLLAALDDHHSFLMPPSETTTFRTGGVQNPIPEIRALQEGVGAITMRGYSGGEQAAAKRYTEEVHASMLATLPRASCGWVIDLRPNTGGNMWPMLAALKPFLGNAPLGTFESPEGSSPPWVAGQNVGVEPPQALAGLERAWVAVLTGPKTASSGEAVTISFKGRENTRSFGLPTTGLSTANGNFPLPDGAMILLTTAIEVDRTGRRYGGQIEPDERHESAGNDTDAAMSAATNWLKKAPGCGKQ